MGKKFGKNIGFVIELEDYQFIKDLSVANQMSVSECLRNMISAYRRGYETKYLKE